MLPGCCCLLTLGVPFSQSRFASPFLPPHLGALWADSLHEHTAMIQYSCCLSCICRRLPATCAVAPSRNYHRLSERERAALTVVVHSSGRQRPSLCRPCQQSFLPCEGPLLQPQVRLQAACELRLDMQLHVALVQCRYERQTHCAHNMGDKPHPGTEQEDLLNTIQDGSCNGEAVYLISLHASSQRGGVTAELHT